MSMTGYTGMFYDYGKGYPFPEYDIEYSDNFTKVAGRHTFKIGAAETGYKNYIKQGGPAFRPRLEIRLAHSLSVELGRAIEAGQASLHRKATRSPIFCWARRIPLTSQAL